MSAPPAARVASAADARSGTVGARPWIASVRTGSLLAAVGATGLALLGGLSGQQVLAPLAIALLVGLPHGAVDHLVIARRLAGLVGWTLGTVGYAGLAVATFAALDAAPLIGWTTFLVLSVGHFGTADREYLALLGRRPSWLFALAAGAIPVAALMVRDPAAIRPLAVALDPSLALLLDPSVTTTVGVSTAVVVLAAMAWELSNFRPAAVADLAVLTALFVLVPSLWAFGVYFGLWHAVRHVARMVTAEHPWAAVAAGSGLRAAAHRFARDAVAPTLVAATAMGGLIAFGQDLGPAGLTAVALQTTAAITFPHVATVAWLDRGR